MNPLSFSPDQNLPAKAERETLAVFKQNSTVEKEIQQGMSPNEIAEIVSDHIISLVRSQFEETKKKLK